MSPKQLKASVAIAAVLAIAGCSNGGGDASSGRGSNSQPNLQLNDGDVLGGGSSVIRIPAGDDTGIARVANTIVRQGNLQECSGRFADDSLVANALVEACISDQPGCAVTFQPLSDQIEVIPPPLYAPIGLEYEISLVDRDGSVTDPVKAVFCFDVGSNLPPITTPDTFQLTYPSRISRNGVRYSERCEKLNGSEGVLANDEDDEHISNTCLRAELVELPRYASNLSSFADTFGSDGGFVYEAIDGLPPEDAAGRSVDSFTYRVSDGVNPVSDPVRVEIVYTNENRAPVASDDSYEVPEDSEAQFFSVLDNDIDPDALPLSITSISNGPGSGVANIRNGVVIEYRPGAEFVGADSFSYTAVDSGGLAVTANVTINVANVNDAPMAQNDTVSTNENTPIEIRVRDNDSDPEGSLLSVTSVAEPLHGVAVITAAGNVLYTPDLNYSGPDSFEYTISDGAASATATVVMQVVFVNVGPSPSADQLFLSEGSSEEFDLLTNDTDGDSDPLTITGVTAPNNGAVVLLVSGNVRYTPNPGFSGNDTFNYTVSDGTVEATSTVTVTITAVNDIPIAANDSAVTDKNVPVSVNVLDNDSDPDGNALTVVSVSAPATGTAIINADARGVSYTPAENFSGQVGFTYTIDDGNGATATASVTVVVNATNASPVAVDDSASTAENDAILIAVLDNDSDPDGDSLTVAVEQAPANGSALAIGSGAIRYTPVTGFTGLDSFSYSVTDSSGLSAFATVAVSVSNTNDAPVAEDDASATNENVAVEINVLANDNDADGDALAVLITAPAGNGTAAVVSGGILYTPQSGYSGVDQFSYSVTDPSGASDTASVTVNVSNVNQNPVAGDDTRATEENDPVSISVLANDSDPDGDALSLSVVSQPANGMAAVNQPGTRIVYSPASGFSGEDSFIYQVSDGNGGAASATVSVTVSNVNAVPTAIDDVAQAVQNAAVNFNVLANDSDPDGDPLTVSIVTLPANGVATVLADNQVAYTSAPAFVGADSIVYAVNDGNGGTATATVAITVVSANRSPLILDDAITVTQDQTIDIEVLSNDSDPDGDTLVLAATTAAANGIASINNNVVTYTPTPGYSGGDSFGYTVSDNNGGTGDAVVTITVTALNAAPLAVDDSAVTDQDTGVAIPVLDNDRDPDGDALTVSITTPPGNGSVSIGADSQISYVPAAAFSGTDSFVYAIADERGASATATVTIVVNAVAGNQAPLAANDLAETDQDLSIAIDVLANDSDPDGDALTLGAIVQPLNGMVVVNSAGELIYSPTAGFFGADTFTYEATDPDGAADAATVSVTVNAVQANVLPIAADDVATTDQEVPVDIDVLVNDTDADADVLTVIAVTLPANGTAVVNGNGGITYAPNEDFFGVDNFAYTATDNVTGTSTANVMVTVTAAVPVSSL